MASQQVFQEAFEQWVPEALQVAYDYCDGHPDTRRFWVIALTGTAVSVSAAYDVNGSVLRPHELDQQIPGLDCSTEAQLEMIRPLTEITQDFVSAVRAAGEEMPERIVLRYEVEQEAMEASMTYDDLQPGLGPEDRLPNGPLIEQWVERLRTTGNDSADA